MSHHEAKISRSGKSHGGNNGTRRSGASLQRLKRRFRMQPTLLPLEERAMLSTIVVNNPTDTPVAGQTDLREAIALANADTSASSIELELGVAPATITLTQGQLELSNTSCATSIYDGVGQGAVTVTGNDASRVFQIDLGVTASISGLTITGGNAANGGGLSNYGVATVTDCTLEGNVATNDGGGLNNRGSITLIGSSVSGNSAGFAGGGLGSFASATLIESTISGNSAQAGGGVYDAGTIKFYNCSVAGNSAIYLNDPVLGGSGGGVFEDGIAATLSDCTISGNSASGDAGGVLVRDSNLTLTNSTLSDNSAVDDGAGVLARNGTTSLTDCTVSGNDAGRHGGGIYNSYGTVYLGNTIVAGNTAGTGSDVIGTINSLGNNLIGETDGSTGWVAGSDLTGTVASPLDPLLGPLADNGGPTQTMALLTGSPAIDAGNNALIPSGVTTDQRGYIRIYNHTVDIGAFELQPPPDSIEVSPTNPTLLAGETAQFTAVGIFPDGEQLDITDSVTWSSSTSSVATISGTGLASGQYPGTSEVTASLEGATSPVDNLTVISSDYVVNTTSSSLSPGDGLMSLPEAIALANTPYSGSVSITFDPTVFATPQTIILAGSQLELSNTSETVTITGPAVGVDVSGGGLSRVFNVDAGVKAFLSDLTLTGGNALSGAGLENYGTVTLTDCNVSGNATSNSSPGYGAGINNYGTATLTDCTISGNNTLFHGAGVANQGKISLNACTISGNFGENTGGGLFLVGTATLVDCTVSGNTGIDGGGGLADFSTVVLTSCTVSNNTGTSGGVLVMTGKTTLNDCTVSGNSGHTGGGIFGEGGGTTLNDCTVSGNSSAKSGGGLYSRGGSIKLTNTIVAGNTAAISDPDVAGAFSSLANNLIGETDGSTGLTGGTNLTGTVASPLNPLLGPLANYGGPTQTMALLPGSPAIDAGGNSLIPAGTTTDERGLPRIVNTKVDIGAFESSGFTLTAASGGGQSTGALAPFSSSLVVTVAPENASEPVSGGVVTFTPPSSGSSAVLSGSNQAAIGSDGTASVTATANGVVGSYTVSATASGITTAANFGLTNTIESPIFSDLSSQTIVYGTSTTLTGSLAAGTIYPTGSSVSITLDSVVETATVENNGEFSAMFDTSSLSVAGGPYTVTYAFAGNGAFSATSDTSTSVTVTPAPLTVTATNESMTYGGSVPTLGYTYSGLVNGETSATFDGSLATTATSSSDVGDYAITIGSLEATGNYSISMFNTNALTVNPASLSVTADDQSMIYGHSVPDLSFSYSGLVNGDTSADFSGCLTTTATSTSDIGLYPITEGDLAATGDYTIGSFTAGTLEVDPSTTAITVSAPTVTYNGDGTVTVTVTEGLPLGAPPPAGGGLPLPPAAGAVTLSVDGDNPLSSTLGTDGTATFTLPGLGAGNHSLDAEFATQGNFTASSATGILTVLQASSTTTVSDAGGTYDGTTAFAATPSVTGAGTITGTASLDYFDNTTSTDLGSTAPVNAGNYTVTATYAGDINHSGSSDSTSFVVAKANASVTPNIASKVYGSADPAFTGSLSGFAAVDDVTATYSRTAGESVLGSPYTISATLAPASVLSNYNVAFNTASFTITPALLNVTATNESMTYGGTVPALAYTYIGLVNGDTSATFSGALATTATSSSNPGTYPITEGTLAATGNYTIGTFNQGTLTVTSSLPPSGTIYVLDPTAGGALTLSGSASVNVPGDVYVDSSSSSAISVSGAPSVTAAKILVNGGVKKNGSPTFSPQPVTGSQSVADPLATLPMPSIPSGLTNYGSKLVSGTSTATLQQGIYSAISVSGVAKVSLAAGTYVIQGGGLTASGFGSISIAAGTSIILEGGGMSVSGAAAVSGNGVTIFNFGTAYNGTTDGGSFGPMTLIGSGSVSLLPPSSGTYAGILIFQGRDDARALTFSGAATEGITGMIYAPAAQITESGSAQIGNSSSPISMIVDTLNLSGAAIANGLTLNPPSGTTAFTPAQIRAAYGISDLTLDGTGETIAIVDAYDDPAIFPSVDAFDSQFGLTTSGPSLYSQYGPASSFLTVLNQGGQSTSLPDTDPSGIGSDNWEVEEALDVEWAHAIAPGAQIVLVEANSQSLSDLMDSVTTAASQPGVSVVSMSWGFQEGVSVLAADEAAYDSDFDVPGVTFVASTGDYGAADPEYPAFSPNVVAVGGTSLTLNGDNSYNSESGWGYQSASVGFFIGSGGGLSLYEPEPAYQQGVQSTDTRTTPDVSLDADPATGAWISDSYNLDPSDPFEIVGGTSLSAPVWAGLLALVNQGSAAAGGSALNSASPTQTQQAQYSLPQNDYHAIDSGNNGYTAEAGYNLVTGLGSPVANLLVSDLVAYQSGTFVASGPTVGPLQNVDLVDTGAGSSGTTNVFSVFDSVIESGNGVVSGNGTAANSANSIALAPFAPASTGPRAGFLAQAGHGQASGTATSLGSLGIPVLSASDVADMSRANGLATRQAARPIARSVASPLARTRQFGAFQRTERSSLWGATSAERRASRLAESVLDDLALDWVLSHPGSTGGAVASPPSYTAETALEPWPVDGRPDDSRAAQGSADAILTSALPEQPASLAAQLAAILFAIGHWGQRAGIAMPGKKCTAKPLGKRKLGQYSRGS